MPAPRALEFGLVLSALSFALLATTVNVLTAVLALVGNLFYVVVYTGYLKRSTDQNIVIGGAAGAVPPLVGYAAATGSLAPRALALPDRLPLDAAALLGARADDQGALRGGERADAAGTRGDRETMRQILLYSVGLVAFTLLVGIWLGPLYTVAAALLGATSSSWRGGSGVTARAATRSSPPLLPRLPRAAVRRGGRRPVDPLMLTPELQRKNNRLGLALFALFVVLFVGACVIALLYLQVD